MNIKLSHLLVLLAGVVITFSLSLLPKYVVNDKEKKLRTQETKIKQEISSKTAQHDASSLENKMVFNLKTRLNSTQNTAEKISLIDSITKLYRDAFLLDSAIYTYLENGSLADGFYTQAAKDALTGLQMNAGNQKKATLYERLGYRAIKEGFKKNPDNKNLLVQQLKLDALGSKSKTQGPMQSILALKKLVEEQPNLVSARLTYAEFLVLRGQINPEFLQKAIEEYTKVAEINVDNLQSRLELVTLHSNLGNASKAKEYLLQLQKINKVDKDPFIQDFIDKNLNK